MNDKTVVINGVLLNEDALIIYEMQPLLTEAQIKRASAFLDDVVPQFQNEHPGQTTEEYVASLDGGLLGLKECLKGKRLIILTYAKNLGSSLHEINLEIEKITDGKINIPIEDVSDEQIEELADKLREVNADADLIPENVSAKNFINTIGLRNLFVLVGSMAITILENADDITDKLTDAYEGIDAVVNEE